MTLAEFQSICANSNMRTGSDTASYSLEHGQYFLTAHYTGAYHVAVFMRHGTEIVFNRACKTQDELITALLEAVEEMK